LLQKWGTITGFYVKDVVEVLIRFLENPTWYGIFNLGTGQARSWNDLVKAVFKAMDQPVNIEYVDMPEYLRTKYQYFTEAEMGSLAAIDNFEFVPLEEGVNDYVTNYLMKINKFL
jgi:ADP-L-glycero-D-manno-heptose 6-epimerase